MAHLPTRKTILFIISFTFFVTLLFLNQVAHDSSESGQSTARQQSASPRKVQRVPLSEDTSKVSMNGSPQGNIEQVVPIYVVYMFDRSMLEAFTVSFNSLLQNISIFSLRRLHPVIFTEEGMEDEVGHIVQCLVEQLHIQDTDSTKDTIESFFSLSVYGIPKEGYFIQIPKATIYLDETQYLQNRFNFLRLYLPRLFTRRPFIHIVNKNHIDWLDTGKPPKKILYLDTDILVVDNVGKLFEHYLTHRNVPINERKVIAMAERPLTLKGYRIDFEHPAVKHWNSEYPRNKIDPQATACNAGVFLADLDEWERAGLTERFEYWIRENTKKQVYVFGTNPVMLLGASNLIEMFPSSWNTMMQGSSLTTDTMRTAKIFHWKGPGKPWKPSATRKKPRKMYMWEKYQTNCNRH